MQGPFQVCQCARSLPATTILLAMTLPEAIDTSHIHRVAGLTGDRTALVTTRPCRARHQTISARS
jgi:predicted ATPase with chaperone activity